MEDRRSITITLKLDKGENNDVDTSNQTGSLGSSSSGDNSTDKNSTAKAAYAGLAMQAATVAVNEGVAWAEYYWNRELTLNDDYIAQRNKQIISTQINRGISAISTVGTYASLGSMGGPIGAVVGAALGTAISIAGIVRSNVQGTDQQNIMLRQMDAQLEFTRSRAGWSVNAASIGEDL